MASMDWQGVFSGFLELALLAGAIFYTTLVLLSYFEDKKHTRPRFDRQDPAHSLEHYAVWVGVMALVTIVWAATPVFNTLSEASAEVGDWFLNHRHHQTH